ncbi:MAG: glycogen debranching enzyme N-terminal domain-containing protein, partial [Candidatus Omnitrophica bacterium]|nr:glycogen debranching enzyme N-terminal domain-containing protein [Candidatus Omnitrophota bacterium]
MKIISFDSKICQNLDQALKKEWLETNQFGGFASSTIISANTRRQHGLLIAQLKPPLSRHVLLSSVEENLYIDDVAYPLSTQLFSDTVYPEGFRNLSEFSLLPFPTWTFRLEDLAIAKSIIFLHDEQTVLIRYQIIEGDENLVRLELKPLTVFRDLHSLTRRNDRLNTQIETTPGRIRFAGLFFHHNAAILDRSGSWCLGVQYPEERRLGLDFEEDLFSPFRLVYTFLKGKEVFLCASLEDRSSINPDLLVSKEKDRRFQLLKNIHVSDMRFQTLAYSSQSFFINSS